MNTTLLLIALLFTKHFIVDFPLQKPFQWQNKGTYGHPGGVLHAWLHGVGTFLCFLYFVPVNLCFILWMIDMTVHYHIDWAKMNINAKYGWGANTHEEFWILLGLDQFLHAITYVGLIAYAGL
jgi:hypothetical protein